MIDAQDLRNQGVKESPRLRQRFKHLPVSGDDGCSHWACLLSVFSFFSFFSVCSVSASTPGSFCPERNSSDAPPPVEIWVIFDSIPDCATAEAESPPPTMENALDSATARAMANVPFANRGFSNTPIGPFHTIVLADAIIPA